MDDTSRLKEAFTSYLLDIMLHGGIRVENADGTELRVPLDAAHLNVVRQFLKDFPPDMAGAPMDVTRLNRYQSKFPFGKDAAGVSAVAS